MIFEKVDLKDIPKLIHLRIMYLMEDDGVLSESDITQFEKNLTDYFYRSLNKSIFGYVAKKADDIVSCALLLVVERPCSPAFITGKTGTVLNVYTRPEFRRNGYAKKVMELLLEDAINMHLDSVDLKSTKAGYNLYKSLGFQDSPSKYPMQWRK